MFFPNYFVDILFTVWLACYVVFDFIFKFMA